MNEHFQNYKSKPSTNPNNNPIQNENLAWIANKNIGKTFFSFKHGMAAKPDDLQSLKHTNSCNIPP
jgi:hypothetical protein